MTHSHSALTHQKCVPCEGGTQPLNSSEEEAYLSAVPTWKIDRQEIHQLHKEFTFKNFKETLKVVNQIGEIAEAEGHHPNLYVYDFKHLRVELYTHAIKGLSVNDFIMAAKIDERLKK